MKKHYCRHCNERLVNRNDEWLAYGRINAVRSYGDPAACDRSADGTHTPR